MADYYSILGLTKTATDIEIKTAFRKLAKIYHPDKNPNDPNAKTVFEQILRAYTTLINHHSRKRYDNSQFTETKPKVRTNNPRTQGQKEWTTTDEDTKRREYYKNHYTLVKNKATYSSSSPKTPYSDYKYVLFATPIAVGLLMLIISLFSSEPKTVAVSQKSAATETKKTIVQLTNGNKPYRTLFGEEKTFSTKNNLQINNSSSFDAVIVVFDKKTNHYLQHTYLKNSYSADFSMLPETGVYWKCVLGKNWNSEKPFLNGSIKGGFDSIVQYQNWEANPTMFHHPEIEELELLYVVDENSKNKQYISDEINFFKN
jgi:curved DNA-binding protein CbpA